MQDAELTQSIARNFGRFEDIDFNSVFSALSQDLNLPIVTIFLVGSQVQGYSTSRADVDLVVVTADEADLPRTGYWVGVIAGKRYEALLILKRNYIQTINSTPTPSTGRRLWLFNTMKLTTGIPIYGEAAVPNLLIDSTLNSLPSIASEYFCGEALKWFDSFTKFYVDNRGEEALYCIRLSVCNLVDAVLATCGDLYFKEQWRFARVKKNFHNFDGLAPLSDFVSNCVIGSFISETFLTSALKCSYVASWLNTVSLFPHMLRLKVTQDWNSHLEKLSAQLIPFFLTRISNQKMILKTPIKSFEITETFAIEISQCALAVNSDAKFSAATENFVNENLRSK